MLDVIKYIADIMMGGVALKIAWDLKAIVTGHEVRITALEKA